MNDSPQELVTSDHALGRQNGRNLTVQYLDSLIHRMKHPEVYTSWAWIGEMNQNYLVKPENGNR